MGSEARFGVAPMRGRTELFDDCESQTSFSSAAASQHQQVQTDGKKLDGRLHPDYPLYCEGLEKPMLRGMLHLLLSLLLPFGTWHLLAEANTNRVGQLSAILYTASNMFCYGTSALYHVGKWSPRVEILLQKADHCGIAILSVGTFIPCCLLLFPAPYSVVLLLQLGAICIWTCLHILHGNSSVLRQVLVPASSLLYMPVFYDVLNAQEFGLYFLCLFFQLSGVVVFVTQRPNPWRRVCGYHEVFHLFVVAAGATVYLTNWSIIRRACDPYVHETNVYNLLWEVVQVWRRGGVGDGVIAL